MVTEIYYECDECKHPGDPPFPPPKKVERIEVRLGSDYLKVYMRLECGHQIELELERKEV